MTGLQECSATPPRKRFGYKPRPRDTPDGMPRLLCVLGFNGLRISGRLALHDVAFAVQGLRELARLQGWREMHPRVEEHRIVPRRDGAAFFPPLDRGRGATKLAREGMDAPESLDDVLALRHAQQHTQRAYVVNDEFVGTVMVKSTVVTIPPSEIPRYMRSLRERSGLSQDILARKLNLAGASSYQRYEDERKPPSRHLRIEFVRDLAEALRGLGSPPITREEVMVLAGVAQEALVAPSPAITPPFQKAVEVAALAAFIEFGRAAGMDDSAILESAGNFANILAKILPVIEQAMNSGESPDDPQFKARIRGLVEGILLQRGKDC
jgi:transcriptional regulator with XRE-family HTH domain